MEQLDKEYLKNYWKLILGKASETNLGNFNSSTQEMSELLDFLYNREYGDDIYQGDGSGEGGKKAGRGKSNIKVFKWLKKIRSTFPEKTIEILEKHAISKYKLKEMLTDKKILESLEPNKALLETILHMKGEMNSEVLVSAKIIVKKIVEKIKLDLEDKINSRFSSLINKTHSSLFSASGELDFIKTINKNLKNYDLNNQQIIFEDIYFYENVHKKNKWDVILVVDESGSMLDSLLHSAIMASIFATLPAFRTKLIIFDTEFVDLTDYLDNIIEIMFQIRLGGGTDIARALAYSSTLIKNPSRTLLVLISDFYDWNMNDFYREVASIIDGGSKFIGIGALTDNAKGDYDKVAAKKIAEMGGDVAALTPEELIDWIKNIVS